MTFLDMFDLRSWEALCRAAMIKSGGRSTDIIITSKQLDSMITEQFKLIIEFCGFNDNGCSQCDLHGYIMCTMYSVSS